MQIQAKIGGILYDRGGKPGSDSPDLEPGKEFRNQVQLQITILRYTAYVEQPLTWTMLAITTTTSQVSRQYQPL